MAADINYKKRDIFIIIFLCFIAFSSTELVIFIGLMMFFASLFFIKRNKSCSPSLALSPAKAITNKIVKIFIGISSLIAAVVVLIMNLFVLEDNIEQESIWFFSELSDRPNYFTFLQEPLLLEIITVILALFIIFSKKKKLKIKNICFSLITLIYASVLIFMLINKETYFLSFCFISYRVLIYFFLPLIFIYLCLSDYLKKYINKNTLYNLYIIVLLCAICNTFIQIYYSYRVQNIQNEFRVKIQQNKNTFIDPEKDLFEIYKQHNIFLSCLVPAADLIMLTNEQNKIVLPFYNDDYGYGGMFRTFKIDEKKGKMDIAYFSINLKNKFWDYTGLIPEYMQEFNDNIKEDTQ